jgi:glutathione S-transferase
MSERAAHIIGSPISPYVRKVLAACALKGVEVALDPIVPFFGGDAFTELSPLRRIPVYRDDRVSLCDSSVICQYLEDRWPSPQLYPHDIALRAQARWLEEFADTRMGDIFIWKLFNNAVISPAVFGTPRDAALRERTIGEDVPAIMDYLEAQLPAQGFFCGSLGIADISIAVHFANLKWARVELAWAKWPRTKTWLSATLAESALGRLESIGAALVTTPVQGHRAKLAELGLTLTADTVGVAKPRKGPMSV